MRICDWLKLYTQCYSSASAAVCWSGKCEARRPLLTFTRDIYRLWNFQKVKFMPQMYKCKMTVQKKISNINNLWIAFTFHINSNVCFVFREETVAIVFSQSMPLFLFFFLCFSFLIAQWCLSNCIYLSLSCPVSCYAKATTRHVCLNKRVTVVMFPSGVVRINSLFF